MYYALTYYILPIAIYLLSLLNHKYKIKRHQTWILIIIFITVYSVLAAFRPDETPDTLNYRMAFDSSIYFLDDFLRGRALNIFANRTYASMEIGYIIVLALFKRAFLPFELFLFVTAFVTSLLMLFGGYNICLYFIEATKNKGEIPAFVQDNLFIVYSTFILYCGVLYTNVAIRSGLAMALGVYAVSNLLLRKRVILSVLLLITSMLIHTTCIILVPIIIFVLFVKPVLSRRFILGSWILAVALYFSNISKYTVEFCVSLVLKLFSRLGIVAFSSYLTDLNYTIQKREGFIILFLGLLLVLSYVENARFSKIAIVILMGIGLYVFAYPIHALSRLVDILTVFIIAYPASSLFILDRREGASRNSILQLAIRAIPILLLIPQNVMILNR